VAQRGMQTVPIKVSDDLQRLYHEIARQINYPKFTSIQLIFLNCKAAQGRIFVVMQKQYWWNAYTGTAHQQPMCSGIFICMFRFLFYPPLAYANLCSHFGAIL